MHRKSEVSNFEFFATAHSAFTASAGLFTRAGQYAWWYLRQITGDAAYENYLRRSQHARSDSHTLTREEFYLDVVRRRYTGVSRCC